MVGIIAGGSDFVALGLDDQPFLDCCFLFFFSFFLSFSLYFNTVTFSFLFSFSSFFIFLMFSCSELYVARA